MLFLAKKGINNWNDLALLTAFAVIVLSVQYWFKAGDEVEVSRPARVVAVITIATALVVAIVMGCCVPRIPSSR
ncbi:MAG TPA: hypothetical protein VGE52_02140 [Pirellulales bacterium]